MRSAFFAIDFAIAIAFCLMKMMRVTPAPTDDDDDDDGDDDAKRRVASLETEKKSISRAATRRSREG